MVRLAELAPILRMAPAPWVKVLEPASAVETVNPTVLLFVVVPLMVKDGIAVIVDPLIVFPVPEKVWVPVPAVKVVALFVKLPANAMVGLLLSFQTAPLFRVTSVVNVFVPVELVKFIVPVMDVTPVFTVRVIFPILRVDPEFIVRPAQVAFAPIVTEFAPVVAITTSSVEAGGVPPTQVEPVAHVPPDVVLVRVTACTIVAENNIISTSASALADTRNLRKEYCFPTGGIKEFNRFLVPESVRL